MSGTENNNVAGDYKRISEEIAKANPDICHDLVVIRTYAQMIHEKVDDLERKIGNMLNGENK